MTVNSTANRISYTGNGSTTAFAFPYYFQAAADLVVLETVIATGVQTIRMLTTDYTISGTQDANGYYPNGGTVNAVVAPASTVTWTIYRDPARTQLVQHVDGDSMPAASIDGPLDKLTMIVQRHDDLLARSLRQPDGDTANIPTLPSSVSRANGGSGSYLGFDGSGNPTVLVPAGGQAAVSVAMSPVVTAASLSAARTAMGLAIGTNVEAWSALLDDIAGIAFSQGDILYHNGTHLVRLAAGVSGQALMTQGAGANPAWAGPFQGLRNKLHNGGCAVAQRSAPSLSTSFQYGAVDRFMAAATAGAVSAGTISQDTASPAGRTGNALKIAGATLTGSAVVSVKQRIESKDAVLLKNQNGSFSVHVYQDTGGAVNYQITIRKPTAADNYTSTTQIVQSGLISVPSATDTLLTFANQALGDVSNGLEIQVDAQCGAVTTKNFSFTEWQLEEGAAVTAFERRPYEQEMRDCQRFAELVTDFRVAGSGTSGGGFGASMSFAVPKRAAPTAALTGTAAWSTTNLTGGPFISPTASGFDVTSNPTATGACNLQLTPGTGGLLFSADL